MYLLPSNVNYISILFTIIFFASNLLYAKEAMVFDADDPDKAAMKIQEPTKSDKKTKKNLEVAPMVKSRKPSTPKPLENASERETSSEKPENKVPTSPSPSTSPSPTTVEKEINGDLYEEVPEE